MSYHENYLSISRRTGYNRVPIEFSMCPSLEQRFKDDQLNNHIQVDYVNERRMIPDLTPSLLDSAIFRNYYNFELKEGTELDQWGIAREPGSKAAMHMTRMLHPMEGFDRVEQVLEYPFPNYSNAQGDIQKLAVADAIASDCVAIGSMQTTIWETSWYLRSMENLMADMLTEDPIAEAILDKVTDIAVLRAKAYAQAGCDILFLGDDIGMQRSILMSERLYCDWLKPRLKKVIAAAKKIKPDILVFYHSCGFITPFISHLIDAGIDVLNPIQPECMNFKEIHEQYGDKLSFHGTIGTQTTMPFGSADDVRREVFKNLDIAGDKGGLFVAPTHLLEPEVPVENVVAYIKACKDYK